MITKRVYVLAFVLLFAAGVPVRADKIDDYIKAQMERQHIPGLSLVVIKDQQIVKVAGYGLANVELNVPTTPETVFKIGSVSKQFIATGIMLLVQDGKIALDDNVSKFLDGTPETWKPITIRHLLTHTSGIVREAPGFDPLKIQNDADVIKTAYNLPLRFTPGEKYEYCNVGYFTLAEIIRKVSGKPWTEFLRERVFEPLGMNATRATDMTALVPNRANGYVWRDGKLQNAGIYFALRPSGAFLSTVVDLAKWDAALHAAKLLTPATLEQMWTPVKLNNGTTSSYGFGWELGEIRNHKQVNHGGSLPGFRAYLGRFVDDKVTVVVLTNGDGANPSNIAVGVANFFIPGLIPDRVVAKVDPSVFDRHVGQYQPDPQVVLTISREGDKLMWQQGQNEKRELFPESENNYFFKESPRTLFSFVKDDAGQIFLVANIDGRDAWRAKKIK